MHDASSWAMQTIPCVMPEHVCVLSKAEGLGGWLRVSDGCDTLLNY